MKMYEGVEIQLHTFLTSTLEKVNGQLDALATLPPGKERPVSIG
jgi:hypothetical protein